MKDCLVRDWSVVCLLLFCTAVHCSHTQSRSCNTNGSIHVSVAEHERFKAGLIFLCDGTEWRVVCDTNWDINDARVVCRELGFPPEAAQSCGSSCFGSNRAFAGATNFTCRGNESRLSLCNYRRLTDGMQRVCGEGQYAGVLCVLQVRPNPSDCSSTPPDNGVTTPSTPCDEPAVCTPCDQPTTSTPCDQPTTAFTTTSTSCDCMDMPSTTPTTTHSPTHHPSTNTTGYSESSEVTSTGMAGTIAVTSCTGNFTITAALGAVSALLLLALVGVVTGWVWSCHRNKRISKERAVPDSMHLYRSNQQQQQQQQEQAIYYSIAGPRDTPTGHTSLQEGEGAYFMIEKEDTPTGHTSPQEGENVYHMIGDMEEGKGGGEGAGNKVPSQSAGIVVYSQLHHN